MKRTKQGYSSSKNEKAIYSKYNLTSIILIISLFVATSCGKDQPESPSLKDDISNQDYVEILEEYLSDLPENTEVAVALLDEGTTEYIGVHKDNNVLRGISNSDHIFEIGSITKTFTSVCLSHLVASGEATLEETLQSQFDFPFLEGSNINLRHLANHTSGLPDLPNNSDEIVNYDENDPFATYSVQNLESYLKSHVMLNTPTGSTFSYSNLGAGILGYILSSKRGSTYEEMIQQLILQPLGMNNTTSLLSEVDDSKLVDALDENGNPGYNWNFSEVAAGTGSIKSSVADLEKYARKNMEDDVIYNLPQLPTYEVEEGITMGLGWQIVQAGELELLTHSGATGGYTSMLVIDKENQRAAIVLSNVSAFNPDVQNIPELALEFIGYLTYR